MTRARLTFFSFWLLIFTFAGHPAKAESVAGEMSVSTTSEPVPSAPVDPDKVDLTSDNLFYDDANKKMIAEGAVEIAQDGRVVKADRVGEVTSMPIAWWQPAMLP